MDIFHSEGCGSRHFRINFHSACPEAKLLAQESHRLLHEIEAFDKAPEFELPLDTMSVRDAIPIFKIFLPGDVPAEQLRIFAKLMRHSQKLDAWPEVKTAFWQLVSTVQPQFYDSPQIIEQLIADPAFPRFTLCITGRPGSIDPFGLTRDGCDALHHAFTTPETDTTVGKPNTATMKLYIELSFASVEPVLDRAGAQGQLMESLLDRLFASPTLQFKITTLDFTASKEIGSLPEVATRIVAKCKSGFYQVEQIKMAKCASLFFQIDPMNVDSVLPRNGHTHFHTPGKTDVSSPAFSVESLPRLERSQPSTITPWMVDVRSPSTLRKITLWGEQLKPSFFLDHFSTLRYGCPLVEDRTDYSVDSLAKQIDTAFGAPVNPVDDIQTHCWRWLAFALFYPRPRRFAQAYHLRTIGKLTLHPVAIRAIVDTLRNPVAELVGYPIDAASPATPDCLMVCTVKKGAKIKVFVDRYRQRLLPSDPWNETLLETTELEALCECEDGSVVVVVPGAGVGWVAKEDVVLLEREPLDVAWTALDGRYDLTISVGTVKTHVSQLRSLFKAIGHQIQSLRVVLAWKPPLQFREFKVDYTGSEDTVMRCIQDHCIRLRHLQLEGASELERSALLHAMESSHLRSRLFTLNLNNQSIDDASVVRLSSILADPATPVALQELRVNYHSTETAPITSLHDMLSVNRTLRLVELFRTPRPASGRTDQMLFGLRQRTAAKKGPPTNRLDAEARLEAVFQGQSLHFHSRLDMKLAFLSVVNDRFATTRTHGRDDHLALPETALSHIFSFVTILEARRTIAWNPRAAAARTW